MAKRIEVEWQAPTLLRVDRPSFDYLSYGGVGFMTPESYDSTLATEECERAEANARKVEAVEEIADLNQLFSMNDKELT